MLVLVARDDQDTLKRLGLLTELQEDNFGTCSAGQKMIYQEKDIQRTLRSHVVQTGSEQDMLADSLLGDVLELEVSPA